MVMRSSCSKFSGREWCSLHIIKIKRGGGMTCHPIHPPGSAPESAPDIKIVVLNFPVQNKYLCQMATVFF